MKCKRSEFRSESGHYSKVRDRDSWREGARLMKVFRLLNFKITSEGFDPTTPVWP